MDIYSMFLFALMGAIVVLILTGGLYSMVQESPPRPGHLITGATVGGILGSAASYVAGEHPVYTKTLMSMVQPLEQDMKVGLPTF
jgi:membrane protein DedA with SNARE-associated domain